MVDEKEWLEEFCEEYLERLNGGDQPLIEEALERVDEKRRLPLLVALLRVDMVFRIKRGEEVLLSDYMEFSPAVVSSAMAFANSFEPVDASSNLSFSSEFVESLGSHQDNGPTMTADQELVSGKAKRKIGRYRLIQEVGVGGMGAVWLAEQTEPVKRRVALKLIRVGIRSKNAIARFEAERQAIAMMDHLNIAKILDAGTTETGQPYFVMEYVGGVPLNKYCDAHKLSIRERLKLMIPVCRAVQHAHQKGIIHRDLKHSNVLVSEYDGQPSPKVIDFGLAKALGHQNTLTDKTMFTEFGSIVGTLNYMSPEQADGSGNDVDTRSDVYSLGIMLYKLLVGCTPLEMEEAQEGTLLTKLKSLHEKDPVPPSKWLTHRDDSAETVSKLRDSSSSEIQADLAGELDWIVLKAISKNRNERYQTANAMALELERFLNNEKVHARPASTWYLLRKFVKRNKGLVASAAAIFGLLIAGILGTSVATWWALKQEGIAKEEKRIANVEKERALDAEAIAKTSQAEAEREKRLREVELYSMKLKSSWSDWLLGNPVTAWQLLNESMELGNGWEADFLNSLYSSSNLDVLYGHSKKVTCVAESPDGKWIASGAEDNSIRIWDGTNYQLVDRFLVDEAVTCVRFSPDSKWVAVADRSNVATFFKLDGKDVRKLGPFDRDVTALEYFADGKRVVVGSSAADSYRVGADRENRESSEPFCRIVDLDSGNAVQELAGATADITAISISGDSKTVAVASRDGMVRLWNLGEEKFELRHELECRSESVNDCDLSQDGGLLATCDDDASVILWNAEKGTLLRTLYGHTGKVFSVSFDADDQQLVSGGDDRTVKVWQLSGELHENYKGHFERVSDVIFRSDGTGLVSAAHDDTVRVWNRDSMPCVANFPVHTDTVWSADISSDGSLIASGSEDGTIAILDGQSRKLIKRISVGSAVLAVAFSPDGSLLAAGSSDEFLRIWDTTSFALKKKIPASDKDTGFLWSVAFSHSGDRLAAGSADNSVRIWDTKTWQLQNEVLAHESEVACVSFSPDDRLLLTASDDKTVKLWNANDLRPVHVFDGNTHGVWRARFSPDNRLIASCSYDGEVMVWDAETRKLIKRFTAHSNQIAGLAFSRDGRRLVTASDDFTIKIWELETFTELFRLRDEGDSEVVHASFSADGNQLITGNRGSLTIRSSMGKFNSEIFLPQNAAKMKITGLQVAVNNSATEKEFENELANAKKCCSFYPDYMTYTWLGIVHYRLGNFEQAVVPLTEALRTEPFEYGQTDSPPYIEAFLTLSYHRMGDQQKADEFRSRFLEIVSEPQWENDINVQNIIREVEAAFLNSEQAALAQ